MSTWNNNRWRWVLAPIMATAILMIAGCGGCTNDDPKSTAKKEEEKKEKEKTKPNFEAIEPVVLPGIYADKIKEDEDENLDEDEAKKRDRELLARQREVFNKNRVKLGHWVTSHYQARANNFNARGELVLGSMDAKGKPVRIPGTDYYMNSTRPASLTKGEWKILESTVFLPRRDIKTTSANIHYALNQSGTSINMSPGIVPIYSTRLMLPFQYHIVLLSNRSDAYAYLNSIDTVQIMELSVSTGDPFPEFYSVVPTRSADPIPLPGNALNWTTIAYLIWDDMTPDQLNTDQQTALIDWLHFGGQLILSGPDCLDKLQNSFLADYLPAEFNESRNFNSDDFSEINEHWSVPVAKNPIEKRLLKISEQNPLIGITFKPNPDAKFVDNTGQMAIERKVGRGRIVATAFSLDDTPILKWRSYSSFFNGCLLRRPPRKFGMTNMSSVSFAWDGDKASVFDPLIGSALRFTSRDLSVNGTSSYHQFDSSSANEPPSPYMRGPTDISIETEFVIEGQGMPFARNKADTWRYGGFDDDRQSGVGGWNDESGISVAARNTLKDAAGISPPSSEFLLKMLAGYLIVLVPINWLVFRIIGRVEWAWVAAPIIAIAGAFTVAKMASLDIGFVRSNTQIGLLELYGGYPRGHITEYSALYTSLSTNYDVELDNPTAQSLPFASTLGERFKPDQSLSRVLLNRKQVNRLENFQIKSNTTRMVHTEHLFDVGGTINLIRDSETDWRVENGSLLDISNAGVVYRESPTVLKTAWIGDLKSGSQSDLLELSNVDEDQIFKLWSSRDSVFASTERTARKIWLDNEPTAQTDQLVSVQRVSEFRGLEDRWTEIRQALQRKFTNDSLEMLLQREINFSDFRLAFSLADARSNVNAGRVFDAVIENLKLGIGEVRLIGSTAQHIGKTEFSPRSTQTDQQTMILVHLQSPPLPVARRDVNSLADIKTTRSSLDFEDDIDELNKNAEDAEAADINN